MKLKIILPVALALLTISGAAIAQGIDHIIAGSWNSTVSPAEQANIDKVTQLQQVAGQAYEKRNFPLAETASRQALAISSEDPISREELALALTEQGKDAEATELFAHILSTGGASPNTELPYAILELKAGNWIQAVDAYNLYRGMLTRSDQWTLEYLLFHDSSFSHDNAQPKELEADVRIAMGLQGTDQAIWEQPMQNHPEWDLAEFKQALDIEPDSTLAQLAYAHGLLEVGNRADGLALYTRIAKTATGYYKMAALDALGDPATMKEEDKLIAGRDKANKIGAANK